MVHSAGWLLMTISGSIFVYLRLTLWFAGIMTTHCHPAGNYVKPFEFSCCRCQILDKSSQNSFRIG